MMTAPEIPDPKSECISHAAAGAASVPEVPLPSGGRGLPRGFLIARLMLLTGVVGVAGLIAWLWNGRHHGPEGAELAVFSMVSCAVSAGTALWVVGVTTGGQNAFAGLMCSILFRTLGPLAAGAVWRLSHPDWPTSNLIQIHVPMFLVSLTVETILVVDIVSSSGRCKTTLIESTPGKGRAPRNMHG